jgi:fructose-specific phosphotransferase system IIA component
MRLSELFQSESVILDIEPREKAQLLESILGCLNERKMIHDFDQALRDVLERENVMSTGIGNGVAIPHAYTDGVDRLVACFVRASSGVDFAALDGKDVDLFFLILGPKAGRRNHIKVLAKISRLLNHEEFRDALRTAEHEDNVLGIFKRFGDR